MGKVYLLGKVLSGTFVEVSSESSDETHSKVGLVSDMTEVGQTVEHHTHQAGLHHQVILQQDRKISKYLDTLYRCCKHSKALFF